MHAISVIFTFRRHPCIFHRTSIIYIHENIYQFCYMDLWQLCHNLISMSYNRITTTQVLFSHVGFAKSSEIIVLHTQLLSNIYQASFSFLLFTLIVCNTNAKLIITRNHSLNNLQILIKQSFWLYLQWQDWTYLFDYKTKSLTIRPHCSMFW